MRVMFFIFFLHIMFLADIFSFRGTPAFGMEENIDQINIIDNEKKDDEKIKIIGEGCKNYKILGRNQFLSFSLSSSSTESVQKELEKLNQKLSKANITAPIGVKDVANLHSTISMSKFPFEKEGPSLKRVSQIDPEIAKELIQLLDSGNFNIDSIGKYWDLFTNFNMLEILSALNEKLEDFDSCMREYADHYFYKLLKKLLKFTSGSFDVHFITNGIQTLGKQNRFITLTGTYAAKDNMESAVAEFLNINTTPHISLLKYDNNVQNKITNIILSSYFYRELKKPLDDFIKISKDLLPEEDNDEIFKNLIGFATDLGKLSYFEGMVEEFYEHAILSTLSRLLDEWKNKLGSDREQFYVETLKIHVTEKAMDFRNLKNVKSLFRIVTSTKSDKPISFKDIKKFIDNLEIDYSRKDTLGNLSENSKIEVIYSDSYKLLIEKFSKIEISLLEIVEQLKEEQRTGKYNKKILMILDYIINKEVGSFPEIFSLDINWPKKLGRVIEKLYPEKIEGEYYKKIMKILHNHWILSTIQSQVGEVRNNQILSIVSDELEKQILDYLQSQKTSTGIICSDLLKNMGDHLKDLKEENINKLSDDIKMCTVVDFYSSQYLSKKGPTQAIRSYLRSKHKDLKFDNITNEVIVKSEDEEKIRVELLRDELIKSLFYKIGNFKTEDERNLRIVKGLNDKFKNYKKSINSKAGNLKEELLQKLIFDKDSYKNYTQSFDKAIKMIVEQGDHMDVKESFDLSKMGNELDIENLNEGALDDRTFLSKLIVQNLMRLHDILINLSGNPNKIMTYGKYIEQAYLSINSSLKENEDSLKVMELRYEDTHNK